VTREEANKRALHVWIKGKQPASTMKDSIADELLSVERETEARVAERCAEIAMRLANRKDRGSASQVACSNVAESIRREFHPALKSPQEV
jgi:hypothetical protein